MKRLPFAIPRQHLFFTLIVVLLTMLGAVTAPSHADEGLQPAATRVLLSTPQPLAGFRGKGDQRDADLYPALAFDATNQRYLAVWQSVYNAGSRNDGFDIYGIFLDASGKASGAPFRISDRNSAARSSRPVVVAGENEFVVAWTVRGSPCRLAVQRVRDATTVVDQLLLPGETSHQHSPTLVYHAQRQRFVLAYVAGDDYLPAKLFGTISADCGDSATSASQIKMAEFHFNNGQATVDVQLVTSEARGGAFRPSLDYSSALNQYLVAWEDRRAAAGNLHLFDIYGQRIDTDLTAAGNNFVLGLGGNYMNSDDSATWTPRPVVVAGQANFLAAWYKPEFSNDDAFWTLQGALVPTTGLTLTTFTIAQISFAQPPQGNAPTGFLTGLYNLTDQEFLLVLSSHTESLWGYFSTVRVQRIDRNGQLLKLDGALQPAPGVGAIIDSAIDDQISVAGAANAIVGANTGYLIAYGRHAPNQHAQDFDLWSTQLLQNHLTPTPVPKLYLPVVAKPRR
jgi:hypothetical protein